MDSDNGNWTHVSSKKKTAASSNRKSVSFEEINAVKSESKRIVPKQSSPPSQEAHNIRKIEEATSPIKLKTLSMEMRQEITNRRVSKLWTQADLNKYCSFPQNTIREIESGRLAPNQHQLTVLNRILKGGIHYSS